MIQLNPAIPLDTPKGKGYAILILDYSQEHNLIWVVALDDSKEIWCFDNSEVRMQTNITMGRKTSPLSSNGKDARFSSGKPEFDSP